MRRLKRLGAYIYMPLLFLFLGYGTLYVVLAPVLTFVKTSVNLILLNEAPTFKEEKDSIFDKENKVEVTNQKTIPSSSLTYPEVGTEYGEVVIDKLKIDSKLTFGDRPADLRTGVGHFNGSAFPGEEGTSLIGGHNTTDFAQLHLIETGDEITITTNYGVYTYRVTSQKVARFDDPTAIAALYEKPKGHQLILYTCSPADMIGLTDERLFVYADLVSGPLIDPAN